MNDVDKLKGLLDDRATSFSQEQLVKLASWVKTEHALVDLSQATLQLILQTASGDVGASVAWDAMTGWKKERAAKAAAQAAGTSGGVRRSFPVKYGTGREGKHGVLFETERKQLCGKIRERLDKTGYVIIKAPPQSGKTYMLQKLADTMAAGGVNCKYVSLADCALEFDLDQVLKQHTGGSLKDHLDGKASICIFLDEVQRAYHERYSKSTAFWGSVKRLEAGQGEGMDGHDVRLVMAAAYGNQTSGAVDVSDTPTSTPVGIGHAGVSVTISPASTTEDNTDQEISLLLSPAEYEELWASFLAYVGLPFGRVVKDFTFRLCGGQVALIYTCLQYIATRLHNGQTKASALDKNAILKLTDPDFMAHLKTTVRSLLRYHTVAKRTGSLAILRQLLWVDSIPSESVNQEELKQLIIAGHIYVNLKDRVCFSSPLHRAWFMYTLFKSSSPTGCNHVISIQECLLRIIERWEPYILKSAWTRSKDGRPKESLFQAETYRAAASFLPTDVVLSPEVGQAAQAKGSVDFVLPAWGMAFEFTRDGDRVTDHLGRFNDPNKYQPMLESGLVTKYMVVDVRSPDAEGSPPAHPTKVTDDHLYTVLMNQEFTSAEVWHMGQVLDTIRVVGSADQEVRDALSAAGQQSHGGAANP